MKQLLYAALSLLILTQSAVADDKSDVQALLKSNLGTVISVLENKELDQQAKNEKVIKIITPLFDFSLMARLSLGKEHWTGLSNEKQDRFTELFKKVLKDSYLDSLTRYTNETIAYQEPVLVKKRIHIPADLISENNKISMLYKFYKSEENWLIYDLEIEGVSIVKSYRKQFDHALSSGTIDDLLLDMEKPKNK
ncbi:phospholipid-binding protein MlaC [Thermodesulfobacteriota bacterium]